MSDFAIFHARRQALLANLDGAAALVPAGRAKTRSHTTDYAFRPDSDFFYLTGFDEPESVLLLLPGDDRHETALFLRDRDPSREAWDGPRLGVAAAPGVLGVEAAYPIGELESRLPVLLAGREALCYPLGRHPEWDPAVMGVWNGKGRAASLATLLHPRAGLHELRLRKDAHEVATMRRAAAATAKGFEAAVAAIRPGVSERAVRAAVLNAFAAQGAEGPAYEPIVATGDRATVLHAPATDRALAEGELVLVDMGAEVGWYASDVTRTYPVGGRFSPAQRAVYELVLDAQEAAIATLRPGVPVDAYHRRAQEVLTAGLAALGVLQGDPAALVAEGAQLPFTVHHTGHFLGLDTHDVGAYAPNGSPRLLEAGMVLTVEPGLYFPAGHPDVVPAFWGIGVRIEDDVLITEDGHEVLTRAIPKSVAAIEGLLAGVCQIPG